MGFLSEKFYYDTDSDVHFAVSLSEIVSLLLGEIQPDTGKCKVLEKDIMKWKV